MPDLRPLYREREFDFLGFQQFKARKQGRDVFLLVGQLLVNDGLQPQQMIFGRA